MKRAVVRVSPSPMNAKRWCMDLECGHEVWVTGRKPKRAMENCTKCAQSSPPRVTFMDADFRKEPKTIRWCCRCQRDLGPDAEARTVHLVHGEMFILHPNDEGRFTPGCTLMFEDGHTEPDQGDMGLFLIGPECVRKVGREWTSPVG